MVEAKGLVKNFGPLRAVDDFSISIKPGETLGLLGPNGAGKSTTIGMMVGLIRPDSGSVNIGSSSKPGDRTANETIGQPSQPAVRKRIGVAPQALSLYEELSAKENLEFFAKLYNLRGAKLSERVNWALDFSGLQDRKRDLVGKFSGGMKRRMNIAVALIHEPEVLLLDEPTVGVDPQSRNHIFESIEQLQSAGLTILYTTHYMEEAQRLCDRVAIMDQGKLLAVDTVDGLLSAYGGKSIVTAELKAGSSTDNLPGTFAENKIRFESDKPLDDVAQLSGRGVNFQTLHIAQADLESVFLSLTGRSLRD